MDKVQSFDETLEQIGAMGPYQLYVIVLTGIAFAAVGSHTIGAVFTAGFPTFHCMDVGNDHVMNASTSSQNHTQDASTDSQSCYVNDSVPCSHWEYDTDVYETTIATQVGAPIVTQVGHRLSRR